MGSIMYLAVAVIDSPEKPDDALGLQRAIESSRAGGDLVEHVCVERKGSRMLVALYLFGSDRVDARRTADQLCRRALVSWRAGVPWTMRSCAVRMIGPVGQTGV
jgi:hypothetical protein